MPKVSEEYIQNKKKYIIDATYSLCLQKTVSTVTMQDIINETGLSQGGIYRFYKDIDEILAQVIDQLRRASNVKQRLDTILEKGESEKDFENTLFAVFQMLGEEMEEHLMGMEKLDFELNILAMNAPQRVNHILSMTKEKGNKEYISQKTTQYFSKALGDRRDEMKVTPEELLAFIASSYSGIQMTSIVNRCYRNHSSGNVENCGPVEQMKLLAQAVLAIIY